MKISEAKRQKLYGAIHETTTRIRVALQMARSDGQLSSEPAERLDRFIADETSRCWEEISEALNITD